MLGRLLLVLVFGMGLILSSGCCHKAEKPMVQPEATEPAETPETPAETPETPAETPETPAETPETPAETPKTPAQ